MENNEDKLKLVSDGCMISLDLSKALVFSLMLMKADKQEQPVCVVKMVGEQLS